MNSSCIILTHQFILPEGEKIEKYGNHARWGEDWKVKVFDTCIDHYRKNNPKDMIILTGHGKIPPQSVLRKADEYYWPEKIIDGEIGYGHPFLVEKGLQIAKKEKIDYACKTRLDTINMLKNVSDFCLSKLHNSNKKFINTHYWKNKYALMDLFTYGKVTDLLKIYNHTNWKVEWSHNGTGPMAKNYVENILKKKIEFPFNASNWEKMVKEQIEFVTTEEIRWIDLRKYHDLACDKRIEMFNNDFATLKNFIWKH